MERGGGSETGKRMGTAEYTGGHDRKGRPEEEEEKKTRKMIIFSVRRGKGTLSTRSLSRRI